MQISMLSSLMWLLSDILSSRSSKPPGFLFVLWPQCKISIFYYYYVVFFFFFGGGGLEILCERSHRTSIKCLENNHNCGRSSVSLPTCSLVKKFKFTNLAQHQTFKNISTNRQNITKVSFHWRANCRSICSLRFYGRTTDDRAKLAADT